MGRHSRALDKIKLLPPATLQPRASGESNCMSRFAGVALSNEAPRNHSSIFDAGQCIRSAWGTMTLQRQSKITEVHPVRDTEHGSQRCEHYDEPKGDQVTSCQTLAARMTSRSPR